MKKLHVITLALALGLAPAVMQADEQGQVDQAATTMRQFEMMPEKGIPKDIMRHAKGFAILTIAKGGFVFSGKVGEGVVVARTKDGWSGPSFIRTGGAGFGPQIGGEVTQLVLVLNTQKAIDAFAHGGNVQLGADLSVAAGPVGRTAEGDVMPVAAVYAYSRSKGLFAGASIEGTVLLTNKDGNERYYGRPVTAMAILHDRVPAPRGSGALRKTL
ncbi:MAG TPA: lipid-binding SYLF domain-containing protein [Verrucomicrobiae bacterium]|nr:lipid-binding SYLF domain-containing protein [Verrucomicrobiae bacterium]